MPVDPINEKFKGLIGTIQQGLLTSTHTAAGRPEKAGIGERIIDSTFAEQLYGGKDAQGTWEKSPFMTKYRDFEDQYYKELSDTENVRRSFAKNLDIDMMRDTGSVDLSILTYESRKRLESFFAGSVLQIRDLFLNAGFPTKQLPSASPYRIPHMFEVDQGLEHPAQVMLNRMIFNIDPTSNSIADVRFGSTNIPSADSIERNLFQIQKMNDRTQGISQLLDFTPDAVNGSPKKIVTFDVETTGLGSRSQVRSVALTQRGSLDERGEMLVNFGYNSPRQGGILAGPTLSETLSGFISRSEEFSVVNNEEEFLENIKQVFRALNEADQVTAHNAKFDITQMIQTAKGMKGYEKDKDLKALISIFNAKVRDNKMFLIDTLEIGRAYINKKAQEAVAGEPDSVVRGQDYIKKFFSPESLADVTVGGKSTYVGVEDFVTNTNLLNLIAGEKDAEEIFGLILKGSHVAEADSMIQDHLIKYIHTGELDFRNPLQTESELIKVARRTAFKSKAITAVTNIADPKLLTQTALESILNPDRKGISGVKAIISLQDVLGGNLLLDAADKPLIEDQMLKDISDGFIQFDKGNFKLYTGAEEEGIVLERTKAEAHLRKLVTDAKDDLHMEEIDSYGKKIKINRAEKDIISLGVSFEQNSAMEMMHRTLGLKAAQEIDPEKYVDNVGNLYRDFSDAPDKMQLRDILRGNKSFESQMNFSSGLAFGNMPASEVSAKLLSHAGTALSAGMKHGFLGPKQNIISNMLASQTSSLAQSLYKRAREGIDFGDESQDIMDRFVYAADKETADVTSQLGISHYRKQSSIRVVGNQGEAKKILLNYDYFKSLKISPTGTVSVGEKIAEKNMAVSFSIAERVEKNESFRTLNLVWKEGQDESGLTARSIAEQLYQDFIASDDYKGKITPLDMEELEAQAVMFKQTYPPEEAYQEDKLLTAAENKQKELVKIADNKEKSILGITKSIESRGVGIGSFGENNVVEQGALDNVVEFLGKIGEDIGDFNDTNTFQANIIGETDDILSLSPVYDKKVIDADPEAGPRLRALNEEVMEDAAKVGKALQEDGSLKERALKNLRLGRGQTSLSTAVENYHKFKGPVGIAALGLTALAAGYYIGKRKQETNLYDETLEQQPTESFRQNTSSNYGSSVTSFNSAKRNPLATAGVVGNLDNRKIGHTQMGNNKYSHLYGG